MNRSPVHWGFLRRTRPLTGALVVAAVAALAATPAAAGLRHHGQHHSSTVATVQILGHDVDVSRATPGAVAFFRSYGRSLGVAEVATMRSPLDTFPTTFGEKEVGETAAPALRSSVDTFAAALASTEAARVAALLDSDVLFEDVALHTQMVGRDATELFLKNTLSTIPYGRGVTVRHVVGTARGGASEWTTPSGAPYGVTTVELGHDGRITRVTSTWDSALWQDEAIHQVQHSTILG
ncbi:nuclear transport factor 2 family protein [Plantactinospora sp. WMMB334]|uniref:nuclear transport factor 2 family protein n=1 Tax=Plantactinospora sp. WMMB334 TaxID=3404119 RepID=UPI003B92A07C